MQSLLKLGIIISFFMVVLFAPFNPISYLHTNEKVSQLQKTNFSIGDDDYTIIGINDEPIFLTKNGELVSDVTQITDAIRTYYKETSYPSQEEFDQLRQVLVYYNSSRNDGGRFKGSEENVCRSALLLDRRIKSSHGDFLNCDTHENCIELGKTFYNAPYVKGVKKSISLERATELLEEFSNATFGMDIKINRAFYLLDTISEDSAFSALSETRSSVLELRAYKETIESTLFRTPIDDPAEYQKCVEENCFALCPDISFNGTYLGLIEDYTDTLITKIEPFSNYKNKSTSLYANTLNRLNFLLDEKKAGEVLLIYEPLSFQAQDLIIQGKDTLLLVSDDSLRANVTHLETLDHKINQSLEVLNFSTIDEDLTAYQEAINEVTTLLPIVISTYNATLTAKSDAYSALFILSTKDLSTADKKTFDKLSAIAAATDANFSQGLSGADLTQVTQAYSDVSKQSHVLLKNEAEGIISLPTTKFRAFARRVNQELANIVSKSRVVSSTSISDNKLPWFGGIAVVSGVSLFSLSFFVFIRIYSRFRKAPQLIQFAVIGLYLIFVGILIIFSALFYLALEKTALAADVTEFTADLVSKKSVFVVIDETEASPEGITAMKSCGNTLSQYIQSNNRTVTSYDLTESDCSVLNSSGETISKSPALCLNDIKNNTAFIFKFTSKPEKPVFSTSYDTKAFIYGDSLFYSTCTFAGLFK